jgi:hypothetical protein
MHVWRGRSPYSTHTPAPPYHVQDGGPDTVVWGYTSEAWQGLLNATFDPWGPSFGAAVGAQYAAETATNPQMAYDAISTDYGLTCAGPDIARAALPPSGRFSSPLYLFVNTWSPAVPVPTWIPGYSAHYAFHTWDLTAGTEAWADQGYMPQVSDVAHGAALQVWWYQLAAYGRLNASTGWLPADDVPGWPDHCGTFVIAPNATSGASAVAECRKSVGCEGEECICNHGSGAAAGGSTRAIHTDDASTLAVRAEPGGGSAIVVDYRAGACAFWAGAGFDQRWWWCD